MRAVTYRCCGILKRLCSANESFAALSRAQIQLGYRHVAVTASSVRGVANSASPRCFVLGELQSAQAGRLGDG